MTVMLTLHASKPLKDKKKSTQQGESESVGSGDTLKPEQYLKLLHSLAAIIKSIGFIHTWPTILKSLWDLCSVALD